MSTQTLIGHSFPTPCKRCGGALYRQVDYCPYCGAVHPLDAGPHKRTVIPGSRASATGKTTQKNSPDPMTPDESGLAMRATGTGEQASAEAALPASALVSPDTPVPPLPALPGSAGRGARSVGKVLFAIGAVVAIGLAYVGYALFSDTDLSGGNSGQSNETEITQDARTTTGTIAPYTPAQSANQAAVTGKPAVSVAPARPAQVIPPTPVAPLVTAAPVKPAAPRFSDAAQALQSARLALRANDLSSAQAALGAAQALQPGSSGAQDLAGELKPLIARRDAALQAAQTCAAQQSWPCARQHANEALAIDTGNETAKSILERVIRETGWAPLNPHAATGTQPQVKPPAQAQAGSPSQQAVQLQTPLPQGMPANNAVVIAAPRPAVATADNNSVDARLRAIKDSGWNRAPANAAKSSTGTTARQ
ncbi:hypothetical protein BCh11DRAFT_01478 [Burkholderia sp. Ch1-1]|uniref:Zinc ribbon domain-containing protein n=1 Tax=Paraburkholderia dioscoreae TaxID=2604047 RepID=A0A5Q4Z375_9BURK|nr:MULTISPECIES: hypothetical protein [Paraburkholderia]EIF33699.1 hypothetical protein BCh11DRAFT_01478 [Burkholderia sp. Ch1-1]MDR8399698.1 hypothetical protein [Paraburkholderia sp. USG1]VVD32574.1 conserved protein of unknown function [Paraburkholderia dioscoreae]